MHGIGHRGLDGIQCRRAEKAGRDKARILQPDDLYFVVSTAVWNNPDQYQELIKYKISPFYNPRVPVPRSIPGWSVQI